MNPIPVLVTTAQRGVFFGLLEEDSAPARVVLTRARCAILFATTKGFLELASDGPNRESKIGAEADRLTLYDITSVSEVTEQAAQRWHDHGK